MGDVHMFWWLFFVLWLLCLFVAAAAAVAAGGLYVVAGGLSEAVVTFVIPWGEKPAQQMPLYIKRRQCVDFERRSFLEAEFL